MKKKLISCTLLHWIAAVALLPRNDGCLLHPRNCEPKAWQSRAFSLIELLISLIIISLIVSSFIPIITRKIKHHNATLAAGVMNCKKFDEKCMLCDKKECTLCTTQINLLDGQYVDPKESCEVKQCPSGCKKCNSLDCLECKEGFKYNATNKKCEMVVCSTGQYLDKESCKTCPNGTYQEANNHQMTSCIVCPEGSFCANGKKESCSENCKNCSSDSNCTKCEEGYTLSGGKCVKGGDCYTVAYSKICIAKFNAGDPGGLEIPEGLVEMKVAMATKETDDGNAYKHYFSYCWRGNNAGTCDTGNGGYSGCNRTVCTWHAAKKICEYHGWRLPKRAEIGSFFSYSYEKGVEGLQLCVRQPGYSSAICAGGLYCPNSHTGRCFPDRVWSVEPSNTNAYAAYYLTTGKWNPISTSAIYPASVRCVKDL